MTLADYLAKKKLTQQAFAALVGCTQVRISQLLAGERPSLTLALTIQRKTGGKVPVDAWPEAVPRAEAVEAA